MSARGWLKPVIDPDRSMNPDELTLRVWDLPRALQVGSGLFADDDIASAGPLVKSASGALSQALTKWHNTFGQWLVIALVARHVRAAPPASVDSFRSRVVALAVVVACAAVVRDVVVGLGR